MTEDDLRKLEQKAYERRVRAQRSSSIVAMAEAREAEQEMYSAEMGDNVDD